MLKKKLLAMLLSISICSAFATTSGVFATTDEQQDTNCIEFISKDFESGEVKTESVDLTGFSATETFGSFDEITSQPIENIGGDTSILPNSIIGEDNAYEITSTGDQPYRSICHIKTYWDANGDGIYEYISGGSGFMVSKSIVYTNAHVIYHSELGGYPTKIEVSPARNRYYAPFTSESKKCFVSSSYIRSSDNDYYKYDWGAIILKDNIGERSGWLGLKYFDEDHDGTYDNYVGQNVSVIGYPQGRDNNRYSMWRSDGQITYQNNEIVHHNCDTSGGNSGSPILNTNNQVIAVHNAGATTYNQGVLVSSQMIGSLDYFKYTYEQ